MNVPVCRNHPERAAAWRCPGCGAVLCGGCVHSIIPGRLIAAVCRACGGRCRALDGGGAAPAAAAPSPSLLRLVPGVFLYPLRGRGWLLLVLGALFFAMVAAAGRMILSVPLAVFGGGYLAACLMRIVRATANGDNELPPWPGVSDFFEDIVAPFFLLLAALAACLGPAAAAALAGTLAWRPLGAAAPFLLLAGLACLPMGLLGVAVLESVEGLSPRRVLVSIARVLPSYLLVLALLAGLEVHRHLARLLLRAVPYAGALAGGVVSMYVLAVQMRLLGLLYRTGERRLGWFPEAGR